jgi:hypothetical protein
METLNKESKVVEGLKAIVSYKTAYDKEEPALYNMLVNEHKSPIGDIH